MRGRFGKWRLLGPVLGVAALIGITIITIVRLQPRPSSAPLPPPSAEPLFTLPGTIAGPQVAISLLPSGSRHSPESTHSLSESTTSVRESIFPGRAAGPSPTGMPVTVTGSYRELSGYGDSFIGEVVLTNRSAADQDWVATVTYPGSLRTSWLESLPQPTVVRRGQTFTWASSAPLTAGATVRLRFHFDRADDSDAPTFCAVNGSLCAE
jgi:hypothetical protein